MLRKSSILLLLLLSLSCSTGKVVFKEAGFSIRPLDFPADGSGKKRLVMFLAEDDGFAPNINVQIQPFEGSLDDYMKISRTQFALLGLTPLNSKVLADRIIIEYTGSMMGRDLHSYAIAFKKKKLVYLVTGTALESHWKRYKNQIKKSVDSFRLIE